MSPQAASAKSADSGKSAKSANSGAMKKPSALPERLPHLDTLSQVSAALSRSQSLNEKLQLLRSSDLNDAEKMELLKSLAHKDWKAIHGRVQTAAKNDTELAWGISTTWWDAAELRSNIPALAADVRGGSYCAEEGFVLTHGFADAVEVTFEPGGAKGLSGAKLSLAKDKGDGKLQLTAAADAAVGEHTVTVRAKGTFNKVAVQSVAQVKVRVDAK